MKTWIIFLASLMALNASASDAITDNSLEVQTVTQFDGIPWGISIINDQEAIVTVKKGSAYKVNLSTGKKQALTGLPEVDNRGQGG